MDDLLLKEAEPVLPEVEIEEHDILIIVDSIVSSVGAEIIDPDADITVECIRGGRPEDISENFKEIVKVKHFKRVIVQLGSNLIPRFSPDFVADRIRKLSPDSKVTFSCILP